MGRFREGTPNPRRGILSTPTPTRSICSPQTVFTTRTRNVDLTKEFHTDGMTVSIGDTPTSVAPITPLRRFHGLSGATSTRKLSASFTTGGPLSGHPTTAYSAVTASTSTSHPGPLTSHPVNMASILPSSQSYGSFNAPTPRRSLKASHTYSNLPMPATYQKLTRAPPSKAAITTNYVNATVLPGRNAENIPPGIPVTSFRTNRQSNADCSTLKPNTKPTPKPKSKSRAGLPRSRTLNVLSNLTASLSRTSLGTFASGEFRHASTSSKGTTCKEPGPYMNLDLAASSSSQALLNPVIEITNPRQIHTAQSSAYWTGRFMALHDRFQSEMLMPQNLTTLLNAHAQHSLLPVSQPSLASSATTNCITPMGKPKSKSTRPATKSTSPRKQPLQNSQVAPRTPRPTTTVRPSYETAAAVLIDEDNRCRRIFLHLEALCTTSEARRSLQQWQQSYARRKGNENLLPEGGSMYGRQRELTWVGRLLAGGGGGHVKKGNFAS